MEDEEDTEEVKTPSARLLEKIRLLAEGSIRLESEQLCVVTLNDFKDLLQLADAVCGSLPHAPWSEVHARLCTIRSRLEGLLSG